MASAPRTALVTGASSGIGLAIVRQLVSAGYVVATSGRDIPRLRSSLEEALATCTTPAGEPGLTAVRLVQGDLATVEGVQAVFRESVGALGGRLDALVNNAGGAILNQFHGMLTKDRPHAIEPAHAMSTDGLSSAMSAMVSAYEWTMNLNVRAPYLLTQLATPYLAETKGCVLNLSSVAAVRPFPGMAPYHAAKAAVDMLTKSAALELAPKGVRVNAIAPATVETRFHESAGMGKDTAAAYYAASAATHPIGRVGTPDDIAELAMFLLDPVKAAFITGSIMLADGGRLLTSSMAPQLALPK